MSKFFGQESLISYNKGCKARAQRSGPRGPPYWTPALLRIVALSKNSSGGSSMQKSGERNLQKITFVKFKYFVL